MQMGAEFNWAAADTLARGRWRRRAAESQRRPVIERQQPADSPRSSRPNRGAARPRRSPYLAARIFDSIQFGAGGQQWRGSQNNRRPAQKVDKLAQLDYDDDAEAEEKPR